MNFLHFKNNNFKGDSWVPYTIAACSAVAFYTIINNVPGIVGAVTSFCSLMKPIIFGLVIAYLFTPLIKYIDHLLKGIVKNDTIRNDISVVVGLAVIAVLLGILLSFLVPQIIDSFIQFANNVYMYSDAVNKLLIHLAEEAESYNIDMEQVTQITSEMVDKFVHFCTDSAKNLVNRSFSWGGNAASLLIGLILAIYFLVSKNSIFRGFDRLFKATLNTSKYHSFKIFLARCHKIFTKFIIDDMIDAIIVGVINFIFMSCMGIPYAILVSVVCGVTNLAPTFGPFVGAAIGGFILLFADPKNAVIFLIFTLILQLIDGYIIKPKLFGNSMDVPGVWVTVGIVIGGKLFGPIGVLLAVPIVGIITFVYRGFLERREEAREAEEKAFSENEAIAAAADKAAEEATEKLEVESDFIIKEVIHDAVTDIINTENHS